MSSSAGINGQNNQNCKNNEDHSPRSFCEHLCYLLPCFKRRGSPVSSRGSSKNSKHNFFLENHYIIKCPKKKCFFNKNETKKESEEELRKAPEVRASVQVERKTGNHKEVRFLGAAKKHCDRDYLKLLGMEPNDYLNQFSSVFIKNLKSPIPKDPCALPKKFNAYVPPKRKSNRSISSLSRITDVRNVLQFHRHGRPFSVNRSVSSLVKEKCASFQNKSDNFNNGKDQADGPNDVFYDAISPNPAESIEKLENIVMNRHKNADSALSGPDPPWECNDPLPYHKYGDMSKKQINSKSKIKDSDLTYKENLQEEIYPKCEEGQSETYVKKIKNNLHISEESKKQENVGADMSHLTNCTSHESLSGSEGSDDEPPLDRNPWPNQDFLQLQAQISNNAFRKAALRKHHTFSKTLVWKLIIKNQKEYIKS